MFENNSKFPKFFIYMFMSLIVFMAVGIFFGATVVGIVYFCVLLLTTVFLVIDKYQTEALTNYKTIFVLLDVVNFIAVLSILIYEWAEHTIGFNIMMFLFLALEIAMILFVCLKKKKSNTTKVESVFVGILKIGSMICMLTYFYGVSTLFFAIDAMIFEVSNLVIQICFNRIDIKPKSVKITDNQKLQEIIQKPLEDEGDLD